MNISIVGQSDKMVRLCTYDVRLGTVWLDLNAVVSDGELGLMPMVDTLEKSFRISI